MTKTKEMITESDYSLIYKYAGNKLTKEEEIIISERIKTDEEFAEELRKYTLAAVSMRTLLKFNNDDKKIDIKVDKQKTQINHFWWIAASFIIILISTNIILIQSSKRIKNNISVLENKSIKQDSSILALNAENEALTLRLKSTIPEKEDNLKDSIKESKWEIQNDKLIAILKEKQTFYDSIKKESINLTSKYNNIVQKNKINEQYKILWSAAADSDKSKIQETYNYIALNDTDFKVMESIENQIALYNYKTPEIYPYLGNADYFNNMSELFEKKEYDKCIAFLDSFSTMDIGMKFYYGVCHLEKYFQTNDKENIEEAIDNMEYIIENSADNEKNGKIYKETVKNLIICYLLINDRKNAGKVFKKVSLDKNFISTFEFLNIDSK